MIMEPTGIPPHVGLSIQVQSVLGTLGILVDQFGEHGKNLEVAVRGALDKTALENGHVTVNRVVELMESYQQGTVNTLQTMLNEMRKDIKRMEKKAAGNVLEAGVGTLVNDNDGRGDEDNDSDNFGGAGDVFFDDDDDDGGGGGEGGQGNARGMEGGPPRPGGYPHFNHPDGKFYWVPVGYEFPAKSNLREALRCWMFDQVVAVDDNKVMRALRKFKVGMFPASLQRKFRSNWQPIFRFLDPVLSAVPKRRVLSDTAFDVLYDDCIAFLKSRVSYLWGPRRNPELFVIGTWSMKTSYSEIMKHGTVEDKSFLSEPGKRNVVRCVGKISGTATTTNTTTTAAARSTTTTATTTTASTLKRKTTARTTNPTHVKRRDKRNERMAIAAAATGVPLPASEGRLGVPLSGTIGGGGVLRGSPTGGGTSAGGGTSVSGGDRVSGGDGVRKKSGIGGGDEMQQVSRPTAGIFATPRPVHPVMTAAQSDSTGRKVGNCCVTGCNLQLQLLHTCHGCGKFVHMPCAEKYSDLSEDERYCDICSPKKD